MHKHAHTALVRDALPVEAEKEMMTPTREGARILHTRSMRRMTELTCARRLELPAQTTRTQSFSTDTLEPTEATLACQNKFRMMGCTHFMSMNVQGGHTCIWVGGRAYKCSSQYGNRDERVVCKCFAVCLLSEPHQHEERHS